MNWKVIFRNTGYALLVSAIFMFLSIIVSVLNGNDSALAALSISFVITFIVGIFPFIFVRKTSGISLKEGYVIITMSWFLSFVVGMLPYALWGGPFTIQNAWFESVSGFTTTGATILEDIEALPKSLLFWRSSTHFIGGLGVVVFLLLIIPGANPIKMRLTNMELSSLTKGSISTRANKIVYIFAYIYLGMLPLAFGAYLLCGMDAFDAICHAMSVVATGGFSTRNASIGAFDSRAVEAVTMVFMYLCSLNFGLIYLAIVNRSLKPFNNPVPKFFTGMVLLFAAILTIALKTKGICETWGQSAWNGLFHVLCVSSTSGFALLDNSAWPMSVCSITLFMAVMCGCAGSTSGGLKADRMILLFKTMVRRINVILHPSAINEIKMGKRFLRIEDVMPHMLYIAMYGFFILVAVLLSFALGVDANNSFFASIACISNVGPSVGDLGTMGSFNSISAGAKLLYTLDMFLGRIEIYPILAVVAMIFDRRRM